MTNSDKYIPGSQNMRIVLRDKMPLATDRAQEMAKWEARRLEVFS